MLFSLTTRSRRVAALMSIPLALLACGSPDEPGTAAESSGSAAPTASPAVTPAVTDGRTPAEHCPDGEVPILAAYSLRDGALQWVTCDASPDMHLAVAADATSVWVEVPYPPQILRIDAATGTVVESSTDPATLVIPDGTDRTRRTPPSTASVQIAGGQDDPLVGTDRATGMQRWTAVGSPVYDDVWAADTEAVYVQSWDSTGAAPGSWWVAYDIDTGEERWRVDAVGPAWPWHAAQDRVFMMWFDLHVLDAATGAELWHTDYGDPPQGFPRMFGAVTNADMVFVGFTSVGSGGD